MSDEQPKSDLPGSAQEPEPKATNETNVIGLPQVSWFTRILQFFQSTMGLIGGAYAIWSLIRRFREDEERFELVMVKRV